MEAGVPIIILAVALLFMGLGALFDDRRARYRRQLDVVGEPVEAVIPLLHSINDDRCIGCEACIDVCPTEVLDLVDHKVRVARFTDCVQCEQCATSCPTQALVMYRQGSTPRMLTVPELDENFQTGVPGQYLIGEIAGKPLVKNAANLGRAAIEHIVRQLRAQPAPAAAGVLDVVIVGSGPGGLSAGLTCMKEGVSCVVLEKEHIISSTVSRYPKGKHFMAEPCTAQNVSYLPVFDSSKEDLVAAWQRVVEGVKLPIKLGEAVESIARGDDGIFTVKTTVAKYRSRTVVLATGLRGKPRLLTVPGANLEKVQSLLDDPAEFAGEHVLVVGGGDSAVEGAMSLADVGATVTLSYRGDGFKRCKQGNQRRLAEMLAAGKLSVLLESNVTQFTAGEVSIKLKDGTVTTLPNQRAFVLIGADTPVAWLEANNVRFVERPHLYTLGSTEDVVRRVAPAAMECPRTPEEAVAIVLGQEVHKTGRRVLSVIGHIRDEFQEVVTQVSGAFKLSDLEGRPRGGGEVRNGHLPGVHRHVPDLVPASRLTASHRALPAQARAVAHNEFAEERTAVGVSPFRSDYTPVPRRFPDDRSYVGAVPLRPKSVKRGVGFDTGTQTASVAAIRDMPPAPGRKPLPRQLSKLGVDTGTHHAIEDAFDVALGNAPRPAPMPARPASKIGVDTGTNDAIEDAFAAVTSEPAARKLAKLGVDTGTNDAIDSAFDIAMVKNDTRPLQTIAEPSPAKGAPAPAPAAARRTGR